MTLSGIATDDALVVFAKASDDERRLLRAAVLGAQEQRLAHVEASFLEGDGDASLTAWVVGTSPFTRLSQGVVDALSLADNNLAGIYIECSKQQ